LTHLERREEIVRALAKALATDTSLMVQDEAYHAVLRLTEVDAREHPTFVEFHESQVNWALVNPYLEPELRREVGKRDTPER
jgi:hypothetical protein